MQELNLFDIGLSDRKIEISQSVESSYADFCASYDTFAVILAEQFDLFYTKGIEAADEYIISERYFDDYLDSYGEYINCLGKLFFGRIKDISRYKDINLEFLTFFHNAEKMRVANDYPYRTNFLMMQRVGIMAQIAGFLYQIYQAQADPNLPVFRYMEMGAQHLGYNKQKMYNRMNGAIRMKNDTKVAISLFNAMLGKSVSGPFSPCSNFENQGAAMADYPYTFKSAHSKVVKIASLNLHGGFVNTIYNKVDCSINMGLGAQAALFALPVFGNEIVLSFAGSELAFSKRTVHNVITDIVQIYFGPETTYMAAVGLLKDIMSAIPNDDIYVMGHSLGGGLMQYSCIAMADYRLHGIGYNSAGLSAYSRRTLTAARINKMELAITQIRSNSDFVSNMGRQIGKSVKYVDTKKKHNHSIDDLILAMNGNLISCYC